VENVTTEILILFTYSSYDDDDGDDDDDKKDSRKIELRASKPCVTALHAHDEVSVPLSLTSLGTDRVNAD